MQNNTNLEDKKIYIYPCKNSKRFASFFGDLFISLILGVLIFEGICLQIAKPVIGYNDKITSVAKLENTKIDLMIESKILFFEDENKYDFTSDLTYTANQYLNYLSYSKTNEELNVFKTYFIDIKSSKSEYDLLFVNYGDSYFEKGKDVLKDEYIEKFSHNFIEGDEMSEIAKDEYNSFIKSFFLKAYSNVVNSISENNLISKTNPETYKSCINKILAINNELTNMYIISGFISYFVSICIMFFMIPFIDEKGRTLSERIMKIERVDIKDFSSINKKFKTSIFLFSLFLNLPILMFIPIMSLTFNALFSLSILFIPSVIGVIISLIEMCVFLFHPLKRGLKELSTHSLMCDSDTIDNYFKEIGYGK